MKNILDACCGSRMFWFDKTNENVVYMDFRKLSTNLCDGRKLVIDPDVVGDFRNMPFDCNVFNMVVFDPPHLVNVGDNSWLAKKYGKLNKETWQEDLKKGFSECIRVLKPGGFLVFKWNETDIPLVKILKLCTAKPLFGNKRSKQSKTHWVVFMKKEWGI